MSIKHELRINALESRMAALEKRLAEMEPPETDEFHVKRGFQGFYVWQGEERVNDSPMKRHEAEAMAEELNKAA